MRLRGLFLGIILSGVASAATSGVNSLSLRYLDVGSQGACRTMTASSTGFLFAVCNVTLPSGRTQMRVVKTDASGNTLSHFDFGSSGTDTPAGIAVDLAGNVIVAGVTYSADFPLVSPLVSKALLPSAFVTKIAPDLQSIVFSTLLGGNHVSLSGAPGSLAGAVTTDGSGNIYVAGSTTALDFPVTQGAFQMQPPPGDPFGTSSYGFISEIAPDGSKFVFSTFFGGSGVNCQGGSSCMGAYGQTGALAIQLGQDGSIVIAGNTDANNLPVTSGAYGQSCACRRGQGAGFAAKFEPGGSHLVWATYFPLATQGAGPESSLEVQSMTVASDGSVVLAGAATSGLAVTAGALQGTCPCTQFNYAGFVSELDSAGAKLKFSTYVGDGPSSPESSVNGVGAVAIAGAGTIWVTGSSTGTLTLPGVLVGQSYIVGLSSDGTSLLSQFTVPQGGAGQRLTVLNGLPVALGTSGSLLLGSAAQGSSVVGITNAAGRQVSGYVAPYELISLYGLGLGSQTASGSFTNGVLTTSLNGTQVLLDGVAAPLLYAGPNQINAIVPSAAASRDRISLQVVTPSGTISGTQLYVNPAAPGVFGNAGLAAALNQDGSLNSALNPAAAGSVVTVWATGAGMPIVPPADGTIPASSAELQLPISILSTSSLTSLEVLYAGAAPGAVAGVVQVNFRLPERVLPGPDVDAMMLQVGGALSIPFFVYAKP